MSPAYQRAVRALQSLTNAHLAELKSYNNPPAGKHTRSSTGTLPLLRCDGNTRICVKLRIGASSTAG